MFRRNLNKLRIADCARTGLSFVFFWGLTPLVLAAPSQAKSHCSPPTWFEGPDTVRDGDHLVVRCTAEAVVDEVAEFKAKQGCDNAAAAEVMIRANANRPARPATEVGPPADLASPLCIIGIECDSPKMRTCHDDNLSRVWRRCTYNLTGAHEGTKKECPQPPVVAVEEPKPEPPPPAKPATRPMVFKVLDATNGKPIAGAKLNLTGSQSVLTSDDSGLVSLELLATDTSLVANADGYFGDNQQIAPLANEQIILLSPALDANQLRIILTWGMQPADLDGHLIMQTVAGENYHLNYIERVATNAFLNFDSKQGLGPETITVSKLVPGHYSYVVANYSDCRAESATDPANLSDKSSARIRFLNGSSQQEILIPTGQQGSVWNAFSFDVNADLSVQFKLENTFTSDCSPYVY